MVLPEAEPGSPTDARFAVVMPAYNRAHTIRAAVRSLLDQTLQEWSLLVVDDASTDDTIGAVRSVSGDPRIRLIGLSENLGHLDARNRAFDAVGADVEWVTQLDSDDRLRKDALERIAARIGATPGVRFFRFASVWQDGTAMGPPVEPRTTAGYRELLLKQSPPGEWMNVLHRSLLDEGWRYDERIRRSPSTALWYRLARVEAPHYFPDVVREMSRTTESVLRPKVKGRAHYAILRDVYRVHNEEFGDDLRRFSPRAYAARYGKFACAVAGSGHLAEALGIWASALRAAPLCGGHLRNLGKVLGVHWKSRGRE
jgi:glycosyltransferase involved in cell wall biosynthesis